MKKKKYKRKTEKKKKKEKKKKRKTKWLNKPKWHCRCITFFYIVNRFKISTFTLLYNILKYFLIFIKKKKKKI